METTEEDVDHAALVADETILVALLVKPQF